MAEERKEKEVVEAKEEQAPKKKFNIAKKWWFWVIIGVTVIGVVGIIAGTGSSSNSSSTDNSSKAKTYGMNETVVVRNLEFKVTGVTDTKHVGGEYLGEDTDANFAIVTIEVKNTSNSEITLYGDNFKYCRGESVYEASSAGIYAGDNGFYTLKEVGSGLTKTLDVVYEIPSTHEATDYILAKDSYKTEKIYLK
jgi:hypothetical protein